MNEDSKNYARMGLPPLHQIYFYLTEGCNLACKHCWLAPKIDKSRQHPILPIELFKMVLREAKPLGLRGIKLTGGEPLLHPKFNEILGIVRHEDLALNVETNGILCTPEIAKEIAKSPKRFVSVSIDGSDATIHEWLRGVPGCFELAKEAVRNLCDAGIKPQIIMTLMHRNAGHVEDVIRMAEQLGASSVKFNVVQPTARGKSFTESGESLSLEEIIKVGQHVEHEIAPTTELDLIFDIPYAFRPLSRISKGYGCGRCAILNIIGVIASGHYSLCGIGNNVPEMVFGSVSKDRLEDIWKENKVLKSIRAGIPHKLEGICSKCLMKYACLGACVAQNYYRSKSLWFPYWFCDEAYKTGLFPSSRLLGNIYIQSMDSR